MREFKNYARKRDLTIFVEEAFYTLSKKNTNPVVFFEYICANPEVMELNVEDAVEEINESLGSRLRSVGAGVGAAWNSMGSGGRAKGLMANIRWLEKLRDENRPEFDKYYTQDSIDKLSDQLAKEQAASKLSYQQHYTNARDNNWSKEQLAAQHAKVQKALGINAQDNDIDNYLASKQATTQQQQTSPQTNGVPSPMKTPQTGQSTPQANNAATPQANNAVNTAINKVQDMIQHFDNDDADTLLSKLQDLVQSLKAA